MKFTRYLLLLTGLLIAGACFSQTAPAPATIRAGEHNLTLQWIETKSPGKAFFKKNNDSTYTVTGEQRSADKKDFVTIAGTFKMLSPRELLFDGTIRTRVEYINKGEVCERKGVYHFKASGTRRYWRLQEMDNCEGNSAVDYVDVFF